MIVCNVKCSICNVQYPCCYNTLYNINIVHNYEITTPHPIIIIIIIIIILLLLYYYYYIIIIILWVRYV